MSGLSSSLWFHLSIFLIHGTVISMQTGIEENRDFEEGKEGANEEELQGKSSCM